ncbi:MAG: serine/threonine-protein kinase [Planctomycetota bacterium]
MASSQHERLEQLFNAALKKESPAERVAFLDDACGDDPLLRATVESLLKAHDQAGTFLNTPAIDPDVTLASTPTSEQPGTRIGPYKILQQIGEGGFGHVYMAEQDEPVRRRVALKVIKLGMDTRQVIARFEAERQALALMEHPNIAKVLDAGATESGRPYFAMELVKGIPITEYCDKHNMPTRQRLELFVQVCQAVQHAHQKGIIHRDIKPNNVLVTLHDSKPVPKVIDFGIAKATSQRLTEKTLFTEFRQFVGTPEYMSPDQAEISGLDVDTRTDIYSLGVLLYELLTGTTPFDGTTLRAADYDEIKRIIREVEPPKPSTRVHTLISEGSDLASRRQVEAGVLSRLMRGDLDWIVMKALDKDRTRRYATANDLAHDIERHLNHEPVLAGPPSVTYKLAKFIRRNRAVVLAASLTTAAMLIGLSLATIGLIQARYAQSALRTERDAAETARIEADAARKLAQRQQQLAEQNARAAQQEAAKFGAVNDFVLDMLSSVDPRRALGREVTVRSILEEAAERIGAGSLTDQPEVEAAVRMTIGQTYQALGLYDVAEMHLRTAESLRQQHQGATHVNTLRSRSTLGGLLEAQGKYAEAEALLRQTVEAQRRILGDEHSDTLTTMNRLGIAMWRQSKYLEAERIHRQTLETQIIVLGEEHLDTLRSLVNLGTVLQAQGKYDRAEVLLSQALEIERRVLGEDHPDTMTAMNNLALTLERQRKLDQAVNLYTRAWELDCRVLGAIHPRTQIPFNNLLRVLRTLGDREALRNCLAKRLEQRRLAAEQPGAGALVVNSYAWMLLSCEMPELRDPQRALTAALQAMELNDGQNANILDTLALAYQMSGDIDSAIETQRAALARASIGGPYNIMEMEMRLISYMVEGGFYLDASKAASERLAKQFGQLPSADASLGGALALRGQALLEDGNSAAAENVLRECLIMRQHDLPTEHWLIGDAMSLLGSALAAQGKLVEAEPILMNGYATIRNDPQAPIDRRRQARARIVELYETWGKPDAAAQWRQIADMPETTSDGDAG